MSGRANLKLEKSANLLRETIPRMSQLQIPLTPQNYHIWYEYTMGSKQDLNRAIDDLLENGCKFTSKINNELYNTHINPAPATELKSYQQQVQSLVTTLMDKISMLTKNTQRFSGNLETYTGVLRDDPDIDSITRLISNLIDETDQVIQANRSMETMLESMNQEVNHLRSNLATMNTAAFTDTLTAVPNRRAFNQRIDELFDGFYEENAGFCLLLIDIDHFKQFNDTHGHATGDRVLKYVAKTMQGCIKGDDLLARYGGEEFAVLLPGTELEDAVTVANQIREKVSANKLVDNKSEKDLGRVTVSIGVAMTLPDDDIDSLAERADNALYRAKSEGRNRVVAAGPAAG